MRIGKLFLTRFFWVSACFAVPSSVPAQNYVFDWAKGIGGNGAGGLIQGTGMTTDSEGNVYTTGWYDCDSADFDPGSGAAYLFPEADNDAFIWKLDAGGNYIWAKGIAGAGDERGMDIATDTAGNVYVTGYFTGTADFDPGPDTANITSNGGYDIFVCKLNADGDYVWARNLGGVGTDYGRGVAVDAFGNVYVTGQFSGTADFDPGPDTANLTSVLGYDVFVCKLDSLGNYIWAKSWGGVGIDQGRSIAVDRAGNVYTTGGFQQVVDFDPGQNVVNLTSNGGFDIFVSKLDGSGNYVWAKTIGGTGAGDNGNDLVVGNTGIYVAGSFQGSVDFDPGSNVANLVSHGSGDAFVCKLDTAGNYQWARHMGGTDNDHGDDITIDAVDNVYMLVNFFSDVIRFDSVSGTGNLPAHGGFGDLAVFKLDPSGDYLWSGSMGCPAGDFTGDIAVSSGNVYSFGTFFSDTLDADPTSGVFTIAPIGASGDIFVSKLFCGDTSSSELTIESNGPYTLGNVTYTVSGTYVQTLSGVLGCDSIVTLHLSVCNLDPAITIDGFKLGTVETYDSYQWLLNGVPIVGATDSVYTVLENGDYQVVVYDGPCTDTSAVYPVTNVSISDLGDFNQQVHIFPNPAQDVVFIQAPVPVNVSLMSMEGRIIREVRKATSLSLSDLAVGVYLMKITNLQGNWMKVERLLKEK